MVVHRFIGTNSKNQQTVNYYNTFKKHFSEQAEIGTCRN